MTIRTFCAAAIIASLAISASADNQVKTQGSLQGEWRTSRPSESLQEGPFSEQAGEVVVKDAESDNQSFHEPEGRRLSWFMFEWVANHVHPPHPPHPHPHPSSNGGGSNGGSGGGGSGNGGRGGGSSGGSSSGSSSGSSGGSSGGSSSGSSGGSSSGSSGGSGSSSGSNSGNGGGGISSGSASGSGGGGRTTAHAKASSSQGTTHISPMAKATVSIVGMVGAAAAIGAAIAAIAIGQKGRRVVTHEKAHPLSGILQKRINMFEKFSDKRFNSVQRPQRDLEDGLSSHDYVAA